MSGICAISPLYKTGVGFLLPHFTDMRNKKILIIIISLCFVFLVSCNANALTLNNYSATYDYDEVYITDCFNLDNGLYQFINNVFVNTDYCNPLPLLFLSNNEGSVWYWYDFYPVDYPYIFGLPNSMIIYEASSACYTLEDCEEINLDKKTLSLSMAAQGTFLTLPDNFISSASAYVGDTFNGIIPLVILAIGLPLAFWVIEKIKGLIKVKE